MISSAFFSPAPAMHSVLHSLNIGTLATWLSVAGLGTVGVIVHPQLPTPAHPVETTEIALSDAAFDIGEMAGVSAADAGGSASSPAEQDLPEPAELPETLPAPPELPALAEFTALPEIPVLPQHATRHSQQPGGASANPPSTRRSSQGSGIASSPARSGGSSSGTSAAAAGKGAGASGMSATARLAAGRMPAPAYPSECRRRGQSGTVVVEFTIDSSGRVISAHAVKPSPWPLLDHEAVRTVRKWKFPPGGVMKLQRPIVFQLR